MFLGYSAWLVLCFAGSLIAFDYFPLSIPFLQREKYFAQPPLELLRQWFDHGGWYERKPPCSFRTLIDTQLVAAMGPPGGGRNPVTARLLRHFHILSFTELSDESVGRIFTTILRAFFANKGFTEGVQLATQAVVEGTVQLYNSIRVELLPTPAKSHYTFNLRDLSKVVQGLMRATPGTCNDSKHVSLVLSSRCLAYDHRVPACTL